MEKIEHKCNYEGCEVRLDLKDLGAHMKKCLQRVVKCPSPHKFCGKEMPLRSLYDHIIHECLGSLNAWVDDGVFDNVFPTTWECKTDRSGEGCALCFQGVYFYLSIESASDTDVHVFSVELFGTGVSSSEPQSTEPADLNQSSVFSGECVLPSPLPSPLAPSEAEGEVKNASKRTQESLEAGGISADGTILHLERNASADIQENDEQVVDNCVDVTEEADFSFHDLELVYLGREVSWKGTGSESC